MNEKTDVLVLGGGLAGLCAAVEARKSGAETTLLCAARAAYSGNTLISGTALSMFHEEENAEDSAALYKEDIRRAGAALSSPELLEQIAAQPDALTFLEENGVVFQKKEGSPVRSHPPGHSVRRTFSTVSSALPYALRGEALMLPLRKTALRLGVRIYDGVTALRLLKDGDRVCGAEGIQNGRTKPFYAGAVVLACGGGSGIFGITNNTSDVRGDSFRLGLEAGARLRDMEMVQFHPCMILRPVRTVAPTPLFGEGAVLRNSLGEAFLTRYSEAGNMATRDVMARASKMEIDAGRGVNGQVLLDCSGIAPHVFETRFAAFANRMRIAGVDPLKTPFPVSPAAHFYMGGLAIDRNAQTTVPGLFACGEAAGGLHGANRLAGVALTECVVFGGIAGREAAQYAKEASAPAMPQEASRPCIRSGYVSLRKELGDILWKKASLIREEKGLREALAYVREKAAAAAMLKASLKNVDIMLEGDISRLSEAECLLLSALERKESRGAHFRSDYPDTKEAFLGSFFIEKQGEALITTFSHL